MSAESADVPVDAAVDVGQVGHDVAAMIASQGALCDHLRNLGDADPAAPSLLPGWTVGHVLTHIARNADSALRMLDGLPQYWMGAQSRIADIELGSGRPWPDLVADVIDTGDAVAARMGDVADWSGSISTIVAVRPKAMLPVTRRREVEIHRIDLGLGYGFADLPADYVRADLALFTMQWAARQPMGMTRLPDALLHLPEPDRLAWLMGRRTVDGVEPAGVF